MTRSFFMKYILLTGMLVVSFLSGAQNVEVIKYPELKRLIDKPATNHRIFNFWATWCKPCIKN
jgi:thiol-disulfide isomerase/thioredoxin